MGASLPAGRAAPHSARPVRAGANSGAKCRRIVSVTGGERKAGMTRQTMGAVLTGGTPRK
jgi:hypothetical protein